MHQRVESRRGLRRIPGGIGLLLVLALGLTACTAAPAQSAAAPAAAAPAAATASPETAAPHGTGQIYLYGEQHGNEAIMDQELIRWKTHYDGEGMRHLFVELPYYTAEFLNLWMQADDDEILEAVYADAKGTAGNVPYEKTFYKTIKADCPETIFHGTDVGHQFATTGARYLDTLKAAGQADSERYRLAEQCIVQGKTYYKNGGNDMVYRENTMVENFTAALDALGAESVMGIYGAAHTGLEAMDSTHTVPCMANRLKAFYGANIHTEDLSEWAKSNTPERVDTIRVGDKEYQAAYFGEQDLTGLKDYASRAFWRLENAYEDFKASPKTGEVLPYDNYPMMVEQGQVYLIEYTMTDGSQKRICYRADGNEWQGTPVTEAITAE